MNHPTPSRSTVHWLYDHSDPFTDSAELELESRDTNRTTESRESLEFANAADDPLADPFDHAEKASELDFTELTSKATTLEAKHEATAEPVTAEPVTVEPVTAESTEPAPPQFGLLDVIEAFTAMRHDWRMQTKENRQLAETIQSATTSICQLESKIVPEPSHPEQETTIEALVDALVDVDFQLTRAIEAIGKVKFDPNAISASSVVTAEPSQVSTTEVATAEINPAFDPQIFDLAHSIRSAYRNGGMLRRWIGRQFFRSTMQLIEQQQMQLKLAAATIQTQTVAELGQHQTNVASHQSASAASTQTAIMLATQNMTEGLRLVVTRLRRTLEQHQIQRIDTLGQPFDAKMMRAIDSVVTTEFPAGTVAEQLAPVYLWRGKLLRFAEVRVAK